MTATTRCARSPSSTRSTRSSRSRTSCAACAATRRRRGTASAARPAPPTSAPSARARRAVAARAARAQRRMSASAPTRATLPIGLGSAMQGRRAESGSAWRRRATGRRRRMTGRQSSRRTRTRVSERACAERMDAIGQARRARVLSRSWCMCVATFQVVGRGTYGLHSSARTLGSPPVRERR